METVQNEEISLKEVLKWLQNWYAFLKNKRAVLLICTLLGGAAGLFYTKSKKNIFLAEATFVLEESGDGQGGLSSYSSLASLVGIDVNSVGGGAFKGDNILELYKSRKMIQETLLSKDTFNKKKELLLDRYINFTGLNKNWSSNPSLKNISFNIPVQKYTLQHDSILGNIVGQIRNHCLEVSRPDKKLSIIKVEFKSPDELFAKSFTIKIVETVNKFYIETKTKKAVENLKILQHQADSIRRVLNYGISNVASALDLNPNSNTAFQSLKVPSQKRQIDVQANGAIYQEIVKNLELSKISLRRDKPLIQLIYSPILPLEEKKFSIVKGMLIGGLLSLILCVLFLTGTKMVKRLTA